MELLKTLFVTTLATSLFAYNPLDGVKTQKAEALKYVKSFITPAQLHKKLDQVKIVDVREGSEFMAGRIKNSILIPRGTLYGAVKKGKIKPNENIVLVCRTGHRALLAGATLNKFYKFKNVSILKGGIKAWIEAGYPVANNLKLGDVKIILK